MLFYWAGGQLDCFEGPEAVARWATERKSVTSQEPRPNKTLQWTAGIWESTDGKPLVLLMGHC